MTKRRFPGVVRDGAKAAGGGPQVRRPNGCAGPSTTVPGQPPGYQPFVGPVCSAGRQGGDRHRLHQGQRPGRHDPRPGRPLARPRLGSRWRARGQDHRRRRLLRGRHQGLRGDQRDAAARGGEPRDRPLDPDLPLADLPVRPAHRGHLRGAARALARLRPVGDRRDDQLAIELDHVGARAGGRHRLRAADRRQIPRRAAHPARSPRGDGRGDELRRPRRARVRGHRDRRPSLPDDREGQRHIGHGADRRDGRRVRRALDAHAAARPPDDLRPPRVLAVRAALEPVDGARGRDRRAAPAPDRRGLAVCGAASGACRRARGAAAPADRDPERPDHAADPWPRAVADPRAARPRALQAVRGAALQARADRGRDARGLEPGGPMGRTAPGAYRGRLGAHPAHLLQRARVLLDRPHHERQLPHEGRVGRGPGHPGAELPRGRQCADRHRRAGSGGGAGGAARGAGRRRRGARQRAGGPGRARRARAGGAEAAALLDGCLRSDRPDPRRGARGGRGHARRRADARSSSTSARPRRGTPR